MVDVSQAAAAAAAVRVALDGWRQRHPQARFDEIEDEVFRQLADLHAQWVVELAQPGETPSVTPGEGDEAPRCPECATTLRPRGPRQRQVVTRMGGTATLTRRYWVCPACGAGRFPPG
jgi:uncharacterized protein with PIN domain